MDERAGGRAPAPTLLVVDDSPDTLQVLQRNLAARGFTVRTAAGAAEAVRVLESETVDLVITDLKMPGASGLELVRHVRQNYGDTEAMMITGFPSLEGAVQAVKTGAEEYLAKPFTEEELFAAVGRVLEKLSRRRAAGRPAGGMESGFPGLLGSSAAMARVFQVIRRAAATSATVLISGESGTGKELVARAIHYSSSRSGAPFVAVNCSAIPEGLLESELFGHMRGAFTGADQTRAGFFQTADQGTIFLDEVGETSLAMQAKLLRAIQEKEIFMLGSSRPVKVDVRIVASTNKNLALSVHSGAFRQDLYYRLNVIAIELPPLRQRDTDVLLLARHFAAKFAQEVGRPAPRFSDESLQAFLRYDWPGNVRELENVVQRIVVMSDAPAIEAADLPAGMRASPIRAGRPDRTLAEVEAEHIRYVLGRVRGNRTRAARILGIDRKTLREKLKKLADPPPVPAPEPFSAPPS